MIFPTLLAALSLSAAEVAAEKPAAETEKVVVDQGPETEVGAVIAPAIMPRGSMALYALLGAPDVGGGFRQGFELAELEVKLWFNYLQASALLEVGGKMSLYRKGVLEFVPNIAVGIEGNSGSRYYDKANYAYVAVRPRVGLITGIRFSETATGLFTIDVPWSIALTNGGAGGHFNPSMGFGAELNLGGSLSGMLLGSLGMDLIKEPLGVTQVRPYWAVRLGIGYRLF